jgi:hypothetical protein
MVRTHAEGYTYFGVSKRKGGYMKMQPRFSKEEFARRGDEIYERLQAKLEASHNGEFVAIDIESGAYETDASELAASDRLLERVPTAQIWLRRVGLTYAHRFGSYPLARA